MGIVKKHFAGKVPQMSKKDNNKPELKYYTFRTLSKEEVEQRRCKAYKYIV